MTTLEGRSPFGRLAYRVLSVPIQLKVMGVGILVALLFGAVVLTVMRWQLETAYEGTLRDESRALARHVAVRVERQIITGDVLGVHEVLTSFRATHPDIGYVVVTDRWGRVVVADGVVRPVAAGEISEPEELPADGTTSRLEFEGEGLYETVFPALEGYAGAVRLGLTDERLHEALASQARWLLLAFGVCVLAGQTLAAFLARILTRPLHDLVEAAGTVGAGDMELKATRFHGDEIGELAVAFNTMIDRLREQREELKSTEVQRLRLLDKVITSQEEERARIARELHDELGQSLSALLLRIGSGRSLEGPCAEHSVVLENAIRSIIEEVQTLAWSLRPSILDDHGLESALTRHIESVQGVAGIPIDFQFVCMEGASNRFEPAVEVVLYRVVQEALTNVIRHADATAVSVVVYREPKRVRLLVEDDGEGFSAGRGAEAEEERLGVAGMRERVSLVGGEFPVESVPGAGTSVLSIISTM